MDNNYAQFGNDVVRFLGSALADNLPPEEVLQRTHILVYGLATKLAGKVGHGLSIVDLAGQGGGHGGGPHRLDLLLRYAADGSIETLDTTRKSLGDNG